MVKILQYIDDDDIILPIDDDIMYPLDYVEKRVEEYKTHFQPIAGKNNYKTSNFYKKYNIRYNCGAGCLFTKKMINHWEEYVDEKILKSNNDDTCYAMLEWLNGYTPQVCKYHDTTDIAKTCIYNEVEPSGKFKRYTNGDDLVKLHYMRINELTRVDYKKSFNFFNIHDYSSNSLIQKIRDGKKNGTIVKEIRPDGTHVWKKVRE